MHGDYCRECGEWAEADMRFDGRCASCHLEVVGSDPRFVRADEELPLREVFSGRELRHLEFVKFLVQTGRAHS